MTITQTEADVLLAMSKKIKDGQAIQVPGPGSTTRLELLSLDEREEFILSSQRGRIKLEKYSIQERTEEVVILSRLCINYRDHTNPDTQPPRVELLPYRNTNLGPTHLHIFTEGYRTDRWALPVPPDVFSRIPDLRSTLRDFLEYCNVINIGNFQEILL